MAIINSPTNFRVLNWAKLKNKVYRDKQKLFMVEGFHPVQEAHKAGALQEIICTDNEAAVAARFVKSNLLSGNKNFDVPQHQVTYAVMEKLTSLATPTKLIGICRQPSPAPCTNSVLLIDQIHHPGNLGTIIRSAVAFNVGTIVLNNSVDVYNQKVIQASRGLIFHINIIKSPLQGFILQLKKDGYQIIGTDVRDGIDLRQAQAAEKRAILLGNEGDGVGVDLLGLCDIKVNIKMNEKCESLNVGVAASIIMHGLT